MLDFEHSEGETDVVESPPRPPHSLSFVNDEAEESNSDDEVDEVERSRQLAESVPLRGPNYVNPIAAVVEQWLTREAARVQPSPLEYANRPRKGPLKLSDYDEEESLPYDPLPEFPPRSISTVDQSSLFQSSPDRPNSAPVPSPIPVVPQVVVDFLHKDSFNTVDSAGSSSDDKAWMVLNDYLIGAVTGDHVKSVLDELNVDDEWHSLRISIMQVEPGDDAAEAELRNKLEGMKPIRQSQMVEDAISYHSDADESLNSASVSLPLSPIDDLDIIDDSDPEVLDQEQLDLRQFLRDVLGGINELENCAVFYVRCRVSIIDLFVSFNYLITSLRSVESLRSSNTFRTIVVDGLLLPVYKGLFLQCSPVVVTFVLVQCCIRTILLLLIFAPSKDSYILEPPLLPILATLLFLSLLSILTY